MTVSPEIIGPLFDGNDKVAIAIARIRQFTPPEGLYVAFSGGKDSVVLLDLIRKAGVKHDAHYNLTTVDPPELVHFIRKEYPDVQVHRPTMTMWQLIVKRKMPPSRMARFCCDYLKEGKGSGNRERGRIIATGIRWEESARRGKRRMVELCRYDASKKFLNPIIDWSSDDVWRYIRGNNMPYCSLYDEGFKRLGCVMCPMTNSKQIKKEMERWPRIAEAYRKAIYRAFDERVKAGVVEESRQWRTAEDMWNWYIGDRIEEEDPNPWLFE